MYQQTLSKKAINTVSGLKQSIPDDKVQQIETSIVSTITEDMNKNEAVFLSLSICQRLPIHFAIKNTDFSNDTPAGKRKFHGTEQVVFQKNIQSQGNVITERLNKKTFKSNIFNVHSNCFKSTPPVKTFSDFNRIIDCDFLAFHQKTNQMRAICLTIL